MVDSKRLTSLPVPLLFHLKYYILTSLFLPEALSLGKYFLNVNELSDLSVPQQKYAVILRKKDGAPESTNMLFSY